MSFKRKVISKINNERGEGSLMFVFSMLFFFWMVLFMIDIFKLTYVYLDAVNVVRRVTEVVSIQGGVSEVIPDNYPTPTTYIKTSKMKDYINKTMVANGIEDGDMTITNLITNESMVIGSNKSSITIDYGDEFEVKLRYKFEFDSLPDSMEKSLVFKINRRGGSQYKTRSSDWEGEAIE